MTRPTGRVGRVDAELRVTTDKVDDDVREGLEEAGKVGDKDMKKLGKDLGESFDTELKKSTKNTGRDVARGISDGIEREGFRATKITAQFDSDGNLVRRWVTSEVDKGERVIKDIAASGGFNKVGNAFRDAIGAGFNISGKSPLVALLVPLVGFIGELVAGAIQIVNGLVAVLTVLPNAIGAAVLQVGVLFLAFKGLGTAIQGAFAATNAEELQKALEGLTPAAQDFVKVLLPLRDIFKELSAIAQEAFFDRVARDFQRVVDALLPIIRGGLGELASALGDVARGILNVLANPVFARFLSELIPATVEWLHSFNSAFQDLLIGLADLGSAVMPFFSWLGESLNKALSEFGVWLGNLSVDPEFLAWLERMKTALSDGAEALGAILSFLKEFINTVDKAGGNEALKDLAAQFNELAKFTATDEGVKAMEGLLHVIQLLAYLFIFLINDIIVFSFLIEVTAEFLKVLFTQWLPEWLASFGQWWVNTFQTVVTSIGNFFTKQIPAFFDFVGGKILEFFDYVGGLILSATSGWLEGIGGFVTEVVNAIGRAIGAIVTGLLEGVASVAVWIHDRVMDVVDFFKSLPGLLWEAGKNMIQSLIDGMRSQFGRLSGAAHDVAQTVRNFFPFSPAKEGPLSGKGDPLLAGQKIVERLATGIDMEAPVLTGAVASAASNVSIGSGAVQMNFYGPTPTAAQASGIGAAAGDSLANTLAQRNTRLAVRSIGMAAATA